MPPAIDYGKVFDALPIPCALLSRDLVVIAANPAYVKALGVTENALHEGKLVDVLGMPEEEARALRESLYAPFFHGHSDTATLRLGQGRDGAPAREWRMLNVPLGAPEDTDGDRILQCLMPPDTPAAPGEGNADDAAWSRPVGQGGTATDEPHSAQIAHASTVLVVIDERTVRAQVCTYLRTQGHQVLEASDVAGAVATLAEGQPIDLIFSDTTRDISDLASIAFGVSDDLDVLVACHPTQASLSTPGCTVLRRPYSLLELGSSVHHLLRNREQRLLLRQATAPRALREAYSPHAPGGQALSAESLRILLVEDNAETREATSELLELLGHMVTGVSSAEQALDILASGAEFDVLCSDLNLPDMSGSQLARVVREIRPAMGIVFASGARGLGKHAQGERMVSLAKPYTLASLERALHQAMGS